MSEGVEILVVDDDRIVAAGLKLTLERLGYRVAGVVATGADAVAQAGALRPELVLMDIRLKGTMDGIAAAEAVRARFDVPVVFLTAFADGETLPRAKRSGPFGYVIKPFEQNNLQSAIEMALYQHEIEQRLRASEQRFASTLRCIGEAVVAIDTSGRITFMNPVAEALTGWAPVEAIGQDLADVCRIFDEGSRATAEWPRLEFSDPAASPDQSRLLLRKDGVQFPIEGRISPIREGDGPSTGLVLVFRDITERRRTEAEREQIIRELQEALGNVKTLRGMLPICAYCKKIRDDAGYWNRIESYVSSHSRAEFSHSICPDCRQEHFPQFPARPS